ncbi:MAG TPA: rod shape-determining protein MreD [Bacillota bacterium]|nr:rod shape-determining protein MreD [Bacillota bacterium]
MQVYIFVLLFGAVLILQATVLDFISVFDIKPDLVMLLAIFSGFLLGKREGAFWGFAGGLIEDLFSGSYIGLNALSKMAAGYLAGVAGDRLYRENILVAAGVTFFSSVAGLLLNYLLLLHLGIGISPFYALLRVIVPTALYTAALVLLLFGRVSRFVLIRSKDLL